jgi:hypothetical protein
MYIGEFDVMTANPPSISLPYFETAHCNVQMKNDPADSVATNSYVDSFNANFLFQLRDNQSPNDRTDPNKPDTGRLISAQGFVYFTPGFNYARFLTPVIAPTNAFAAAVAPVSAPANQPNMQSSPSTEQKVKLAENWLKQMRNCWECNDVGFLESAASERNAETLAGALIHAASLEQRHDMSKVHSFFSEVGTVGEFYEFYAGVRDKTPLEQSGQTIASTTPHQNTTTVHADSERVWDSIVMAFARLPHARLREFFKSMPALDELTFPDPGTNPYRPRTDLSLERTRLLTRAQINMLLNRVAIARGEPQTVLIGAHPPQAIDDADEKTAADMMDIGAPDGVDPQVTQESIKRLLRAWPIISMDYFLNCERFNIPIGTSALLCAFAIILAWVRHSGVVYTSVHDLAGPRHDHSGTGQHRRDLHLALKRHL